VIPGNVRQDFQRNGTGRAGRVRACREFWADGFGLRTFEIIRRGDGSEGGAWLPSTVQGHAEYAAKPGWGARLPAAFRTYGTPPVGAPRGVGNLRLAVSRFTHPP
jgi:hypothetical protein